MVLYCSGHESTVLRMLVHKMTYHRDEEIVYMTTKGTYPFSDTTKDFSKIYKSVIEINTALGKNLDDEEVIVSSICKMIDGEFAKRNIDVSAFSEIYVTEDLFVPYTIYFETKEIPYNTIEISPYAFENKRKHTVEKELYNRTITYFELSKRLGAFEGKGKFCKKCIFDVGSVNSYKNTPKIEYDYVECIANLSENDRNLFFCLYSIPEQLKRPAVISLVLTNSRGFIQGNFPEITVEKIPDVYMKIFDYYIDDHNIFLKPHPNSYGVDYQSLFTSQKIINDKFLVDLIPFIPGIKLDRVINVCSTSSALLCRYCNQLDVLDISFYSFYNRLSYYCSVLDLIDKFAQKPKRIFVQKKDLKQVRMLMKIKNTDIDVAEISHIGRDDTDCLALIVDNDYGEYRNIVRTFVLGSNNAVLLFRKDDEFVNKCNLANIAVNIDRINRAEKNKNGSIIEETTMILYSMNKELVREFVSEKELIHSGNIVNLSHKKEKICIFGGTAVRSLNNLLNCEYNIEYLPYISVLSVLAKKNEELENHISDEDLISLKCDIMKDLNKHLADCSAFVFDLETLRYDLYEYRGSLYSQTRFIENFDYYQENKSEFINIDPLKMSDEEIKKGLDVFLECIINAVDKNKIILIRHGECEYSGINGMIKKNCGIDMNYNSFVEKWENYTLDKLKCSSVNVWKKYFSQDEVRRRVFEYSFHVDAAEKIKKILSSGACLELDIPECDLTLNRFIRFYDCRMNQVTRGYLFFDKNIWVQKIIRAMSAEFIEENKEQLIHILRSREKYNNIDSILVDEKLTDKLKKIFIAINDICNNVIMADTDYSVICGERSIAIKELCPLTDKLYSENGGGNIRSNYSSVYLYLLGYQRYLLNGKKWDDRLVSVIDAQAPELTRLDWWGSCISREGFNYSKKLLVNKALARNPITHISSPKIMYNEEHMSAECFSSEYIYRCVKNECDRTAIEYFSASDAKWIVMDIFNDLAMYVNYVDKRNNGLFCKMLFCEDSPFFDELKKHLSPYNNSLKSDEELVALCKDAVEFLAKKYGKNVIIMQSHWNNYFLNEKDQLCPMPPKKDLDDVSYHRRWNHAARIMEEYIQKSLNCYYIANSDQYFSKVPWIGDGGLLPVHYEDSFYFDNVALMEKIVSALPEQKIYYDRNAGSKISRILSLPSDESNNRILRDKFSNSFFDGVVIDMDRSVLGAYREIVAEIYDRKYTDLKSLIEQFPFERFDCQKLRDELVRIYREN